MSVKHLDYLTGLVPDQVGVTIQEGFYFINQKRRNKESAVSSVILTVRINEIRFSSSEAAAALIFTK